MTPMEAATRYAARFGWPIFPVGAHKKPLIDGGLTRATIDPDQIREWWHRWADAGIAVATGAVSKLAVIDIDISEKVNGFDTLDALGIVTHPDTLTAITPRGGCHMFFAHPGGHYKTTAGKIGPGIDTRGDGGYIILPPGSGRSWDRILGPGTQLASLPDWARLIEPEPKPLSKPTHSGPLTRYGEAAIDGAVKAIIEAVDGSQERTLNSEAYAIGQLAAGGEIPPGLAIEALLFAASRMRSTDSRRPWRAAELEQKVRRSFTDGLCHPRRAA